MKPLELFRLAIQEIGDVSASEVTAHIENKYGVTIDPAFIPLFKATLQNWEKMSGHRQDANPAVTKQQSKVR